ncbi:MAG: PspC domain-containing protein [Flavobacteriales bacterium]|jgi:phage shock protein PspC (stress-responsive transcriptional regulator)|nr:MAG: PspC domain-containing protein [Flavobacteriales bacterium]
MRIAMVTPIRSWFEQQAFGVCAWWAGKLNVKTEQVRLSFIYLSFITAGAHLVVYLVMAFVLQHKERIKQPFRRRSTVWELEP